MLEMKDLVYKAEEKKEEAKEEAKEEKKEEKKEGEEEKKEEPTFYAPEPWNGPLEIISKYFFSFFTFFLFLFLFSFSPSSLVLIFLLSSLFREQFLKDKQEQEKKARKPKQESGHKVSAVVLCLLFSQSFIISMCIKYIL